jgi:hypothetical protein
MANFTDDFERPDRDLNQDNGWLAVIVNGGSGLNGYWEITSGEAHTSQTGNWPISRAYTDTDNYRIDILVASMPDTENWRIRIQGRCGSQLFSGSEDRYEIFVDQDGTLYLNRNNFATVIDSTSYTPTPGDVISLEMNGDSIRALVNGVEIAAGTNAAIASGDWAQVELGDEGSGELRIESFHIEDLDGGGPVTVDVDQGAEADIAFDAAASKSRSTDPAIAVDHARDITSSKLSTIERAATSDTAHDATASKTAGLDAAATADTANDLTGAKARPTDPAAESDHGRDIAAAKVVTLDQAVETDTAHDVTTSSEGGVTVDTGTETDQGRTVTATKVIVLDRAVDTSIARSITPAKIGELARATEADLARHLTPTGKSMLLDRAVEADRAFNITTPSPPVADIGPTYTVDIATTATSDITTTGSADAHQETTP